MATSFEYEFWTVAQLQRVGLTPEFSTSFNYFVRDVAKIDTSVDGLSERITENESDISTNAANISANADNISDNADDIFTNMTAISYNFAYLNGQLKPADYNEVAAYFVGEYSTFSNSQYKCKNNTTGVFTPTDWQIVTLIDNELRIGAVELLTSDNSGNLTDHENLGTAHGVTGDNVGTGDYCTASTGGVVDLAALITDLNQIATADIAAAPVAYDEAYTNTVASLTNENKAKINEIVVKINEILLGQITAKQMSAV